MALSGWANRIKLTIASSETGSDLTNRPVLVRISSSCGKSSYDASAIFDEVGASKLKIAVGTSSDVECYVEIEHWDDSAELAILHVKVPTVSSSSSTVLYLYYDSTHIDNTTYVGDIGSTPGIAVWSNSYHRVYHLSQDPSGGAGCILDSTGNSDSTPNGTMTSGDLVNMGVFKGIDFDGSDDDIPVDLGTDQTTGTAELHCQAVGTPAANDGIFSAFSDITANAVALVVSAASAVKLYINGGTSTTPMTISNWAVPAHLSVSLNSTDWRLMNHTDSGVTTGALGSLFFAATSSLSRWFTNTRRFPGIIRGLQISTVVRSDDWRDFTAKSAADNVITLTTFDVSDIKNLVSTPYGELYKTLVAHPYEISLVYRNFVNTLYSLRLGAFLVHYYWDADVIRNIADHFYWDAQKFIKNNDLLYGDMLKMRQIVDHVWNIFAKTMKVVDQKYSISGGVNTVLVSQNYALLQYVQLKKMVDQIYLFSSSTPIIHDGNLSFVTGDGLVLHPHHITIDVDEGDYAIRGEMHLADGSEYIQCVHMETTLTITIEGEVYTVLVNGPRKSRPNPDVVEYYIPFASPAIKLDFPNTSALEVEKEPSMAQTIVEELAAIESISIQWDLVDWYIPADTLYVIGNSPLGAIRTIVEAGGGVLQSAPDGTLICRPEYPISVNKWDTETPAYYLTDMQNFLNVSSDPNIRDGFNKYLVTNESISGDNLTIEEEDVDSTTKIIKVFRIPWDDSVDIELATSGGEWVSVVKEGITEEEIKEEVVEIIAGTGTTQNPVYGSGDSDYPPYTAIPSANISYKQRDAGIVTPTEDGYLTTAQEYNTLFEITYTTKYYKFTVKSPRIEEVQFYPKEV